MGLNVKSRAGEHLPPTDRFAIVFPQRGKRSRAFVLRPLWGRTDREAVRWGQVREPPPRYPPNRSNVSAITLRVTSHSTIASASSRDTNRASAASSPAIGSPEIHRAA